MDCDSWWPTTSLRGTRPIARATASAAVSVLAVSSLVSRVAMAGDPANDALAQCESLTALGRRAEALEACAKASPSPTSPVAARAMVRALLSGRKAPTVEDLAHAFLLADGMRKASPRQPWGAAAMCDIAERIGDEVMLQTYFQELKRVAPNDPETERVRVAIRSHRPGWHVRAGWLAVALASLGTLVHALWRVVRRSQLRGRAASVTVSLFVAWSILPSRALAEPSEAHPNAVSNWPIDDKDPSSSIPTEAQRNRNPVEFGYWLQDLAFKAQKASKAGDHQAAIKYFTAMAKAVPDRAISFHRLCEEYEAVGEIDKAVGACSTALYMPGVKVNDFLHFIRLMLTKPGNLNPQEITSLQNVVQHLREDPTGRDMADEIDCEIAVRTDNVGELEKCTTALAATDSAKPTTIVYQWTLAMKQGNYDQAAQALAHAKRRSVNPEAIARMERELDQQIASRRRKILLNVGGSIFVLGAVIAGVLMLLRRRTPTQADAAPGAEIAPTIATSGS